MIAWWTLLGVLTGQGNVMRGTPQGFWWPRSSIKYPSDPLCTPHATFTCPQQLTTGQLLSNIGMAPNIAISVYFCEFSVGTGCWRVVTMFKYCKVVKVYKGYCCWWCICLPVSHFNDWHVNTSLPTYTHNLRLPNQDTSPGILLDSLWPREEINIVWHSYWNMFSTFHTSGCLLTLLWF